MGAAALALGGQNVALMPWGGLGTPAMLAARAAAIARWVSEDDARPDVLAIQEAFWKAGGKAAHDALVDGAVRNGAYGEAVRTKEHNSGLVTLLSTRCKRAEGFAPAFVPFRVTGPEACILRKGVLTCVVDVGGARVVVANAHLQSDLWFDGRGARVDQIRDVGRELARARGWCLAQGEGAPPYAGAVLLGDLQADAGSEEYRDMLASLADALGGTRAVDATDGLGHAYPSGKAFDRASNTFVPHTPTMRSDFALVFSPDPVRVDSAALTDRWIGAEAGVLSDHRGLACSVTFGADGA